MSEKLQTRHEEIVFKTSDLEEMKGKFIASRLLRSWKEDFVDEDTGETVSIERNEILLDKGTVIDSNVLSSINFYLSLGDITEVEVSNQKRDGIYADEYYTSAWCVTAIIAGKKKNIFLYANSVFIALEIARDFIEQKYPGRFGIATVKELSNATLITNISQETEGELKFYRIGVEIEKGESSYEREYIVKCIDAEVGKALIEAFLKTKFEKENDDEEFILTLISAKVVPCEAVIDESFCLKYLETENGKTH